MILQLLHETKDVLLILLGAILSIVTTLVTVKRQHKMEMQRIAVQNKLDTSKAAMGWLVEAKNELSVLLWALEHKNELAPNMWNSIIERSQRLANLEPEAQKHFNSIELYYNLDDIGKKYNMQSIVPKLLTIQNILAEITNSPSKYTEADMAVMTEELRKLLQDIHDAISEIMDKIRQDNLNYLK